MSADGVLQVPQKQTGLRCVSDLWLVSCPGSSDLGITSSASGIVGELMTKAGFHLTPFL